MRFFYAALVCSIALAGPLPSFAQEIAPVYVDPNQPQCEGEECPTHPAVTCEGQDCMPPQDNPAQECEGENCMPSASGPMETCKGQDCELTPPAE
ncbi:MAG: hypothetical protein JNK47_08155 [Mesorhizobium sp.]|nr:hypothetical protein [Mesorhizobium sp.]MBL8577184.1 hypothetical protein [Mesorhizobium sp.]